MQVLKGMTYDPVYASLENNIESLELGERAVFAILSRDNMDDKND